ncbi:MAG: response regulator transcription factor [Dehalococcoidia bacterium]|nr:response regulator transcription factor [Dehalococcoidia bacterium]
MKLLIIEDDPEIIESLSLCFELRWPDKVEFLSASKGLEGIDLVEKHAPDVVILDIGLPDVDGLQVCRGIRTFSGVPIVILTANDTEFSKARAMDLGADDYITKPFSQADLMERVKRVLSNGKKRQDMEAEKAVVIGGLRIDVAVHEVTLDGQEVRLTPTEYVLLDLLVRNAGRVIPCRILLEEGRWGSYVDSMEFLKVFAGCLRTKLGDDPNAPQIIVAEGEGYKFANPSSEIQQRDVCISSL